MFQVTYIEPGAKLWFIVRGYGRWDNNYRGDIIIPVVADEVDDIYIHPLDPNLGSCWRHRYMDGTDYVAVPTSKKENGWPVWEKKDPSWLGDAKPCNQFVWIDEPVGHAIQVGDYHDGLFLTLQEAQRYAIPSKKKHLLRRLKWYRNGHHKFIASTWAMNGDIHPGFSKLPNKKIYVRKK